MLTKHVCFLAYRANLAEQDETLLSIPAEYWKDFQFCVRMMAESPMCLKYTPIPTRNVLRRVHNIEWLFFDDEW